MAGAINTSGDTLSFHATGFPPGTKLTLLGETAVVDDRGAATLSASFLSTVGDWPVTAFLGSFASAKGGIKAPPPTVRGSLTVEPVGRPPFQVELQLPASGLHDVLTKVEKGPIHFAGDKPGEPEQRKNVVFADNTYGGIFGSAKVARDIDGIALARRLAGWSKDCTGYRYSDGTVAPNVKVSIQPTEITVYDRRSGKVLAKQTFDADPSCPRTALGKRGHSYFPEKDVNAWLEQWVSARDVRAASD
jgi:hypothetical protein